MAENLGIPVVTLARKVKVSDNSLRVERVIPDGYETVETTLPALVTVSNEIGQARLPTGRGIIFAARKKIETWSAQDIGGDSSLIGSSAAHSELLALFHPSRERKGEIIQGENVAEAASNLALKLREIKAI
jgi:electron transfer flavoprotein beta subunit